VAAEGVEGLARLLGPLLGVLDGFGRLLGAVPGLAGLLIG
jgi:hypothetical protein